MDYFSTRNASHVVSAAQLLCAGTAPDGGLYLPRALPHLTEADLNVIKTSSYADAALRIMAPFCAGLMPTHDLKKILDETYTANVFGSAEITPLRTLSPDFYLLELFHGPTCAFKDVALQFLGRLYGWQTRTTGRSSTILGATSGDTGSAAIMGCKDSGAQIFILYPHGRTSDVQRKQMTTLNDPRIHALAIDGTFDDCQRIVKDLFGDADFVHTQNLTAVNSINWFRILAQIVYYVTTAVKIGHTREPVHFAVPTGNFGNVLAGYIAKKMGAPIGALVIGSNRNDILTRFFETGCMDARAVEPSLSPSMDIQISSNFERYLYDLTGSDTTVRAAMHTFKTTGHFSVDGAARTQAFADFKAFRCSDDETLATMRDVYAKTGVLIDPHTAVGVHAAQTAKRAANLTGPVVALACAHPAKFPEAVIKATGQTPQAPVPLARVQNLPEHSPRLPASTQAVRDYILSHQD